MNFYKRSNYDKNKSTIRIYRSRAAELKRIETVAHLLRTANSRAIEMASINVMQWKILLNVTNRSIPILQAKCTLAALMRRGSGVSDACVLRYTADRRRREKIE